MPSKLVIQLLGDFYITFNGQPVESFATSRLQSILAYLLLHHDIPQPRRRLSYLFWPDSSESSARNNLRQLIYQLRQALPDPDRFLTSDVNTIGWKLDHDQTLDVAVLEQAVEQASAAEKQQNPDLQRYALEQAAQTFHGALLPDCYEEWITPERERIHTMAVMSLQKLITLQEQRRDYSAAIQTGQILLHLDPLDENMYYLLMRLHRLNHDHAGAIRIYQTARETIERELGVSPGPVLQEAYERILQSESADLHPQKTANPPRLQSLIGRQAEWQRLRNAWQRASNGSAGMVILSGEAGIGKSRLAEEMVLWADQQGIITARARAYGVEGQLTLAPVTEWLRDPHIQAGFAILEPIWLIEVSRLLPELRVNNPKLPKPEPITEYGQRQHFFEALARAVLFPKHSILLLVDDLQWCDQETIEWLHFLLRFNPRFPLLILATVRSEETHPGLTRLIQQLHASESVTEIELQPLDASETAKLAGQTAGKELDLPAAMRLYQETEGNPLFVIEMVHAGFRDRSIKDGMDLFEEFQPSILPPRVQAVILHRLAQVSISARRAAEIGAVYGQPFTLNLLLQAGHEEEDSLVGSLDELWQKRIIREQAANTYEFTHDKLREVAYTELSAPQRRLLHHRVAQALEALYSTNLEPVNGQIAVHYDRAGVPEKAIPFYEMAGTAAANVYANEEAISLLNRGLELLLQIPAGTKRDIQELALLFAIAPPYRITKGWTAPELGQVLNRTLVLCDQVGTPAQRAQVLYGLQSLYVVEGRLEKVEYTYTEMKQLFLQTQDSLPQFAGLMYTGSRLHMGRFLEAREAFEEIIASHNDEQVKNLQASQGVNYLALGHAWNAHALWFLGLPETALQCALDGVQIAAQYAQPFNQALTVTYLAMLQELRADSDAFCTQAEEALTLTQEYRAPYYQHWAHILVQFANACYRPSADHLARLEDAIQDFMATGARLRLPYYLSLLARASHQAGNNEKALTVIEQAMSEALNNQERCWDAELHRLRGEFLLFQDANVVDAAGSSEAALLRSVEIARKQHALAFELRAALSLARLWQSQQRSLEGKRLLAPILSRFTEGQHSQDIQSARSLIGMAD
jgi:predicted ATPase/DNA-binding SARP family transcriptional activator